MQKIPVRAGIRFCASCKKRLSAKRETSFVDAGAFSSALRVTSVISNRRFSKLAGGNLFGALLNRTDIGDRTNLDDRSVFESRTLFRDLDRFVFVRDREIEITADRFL